jgi:O-antigen ligase
MSIRIALCILLTLFFSVYAWRNYFVSLCAAILMMAIMQHPDVKDNLKSIGGIQGLNLWNFLMLNVMLAWWRDRQRQRRTWDAPRNLKRLLICYFLVVAVSVLRLLANPSGWEVPSAGWVVSEFFINSVKWVLPGIVLFDACRTRRRVVVALLMIMGLYLLLSLQIIKHLPPSYVAADNFSHLAYKMVQDSVGYNRVTLSIMLAGASWAALAMLPLAQTSRQRYMIFALAGAITYGQALTGGRSGYLAWAAVGLILGVFRWRRILILIPIVVVAVCIFLPSVRDRMLLGSGLNGAGTDTYEMTSGRNIAWPYVIAKIEEGPIFGFGRDAMMTAGVFQHIMDDTEQTESFPHPHNAYLEMLLDCGLVGFLVVVPFYLAVLRIGCSLFLDKSDPFCAAVGGVGCALILALLVAAMGGESFYPREGSVGMWAAMGVMVRVYMERQKAVVESTQLFGVPEASADERRLHDVVSPLPV